MNWMGVVVGLCSFLIIGLFHPLIIKGEYHWGTRLWVLFLIAGIVLAGLSLWTSNFLVSTVLGVTAFCSFWSILEIFEQRKRVEKGWFPKGPSHKSDAQ